MLTTPLDEGRIASARKAAGKRLTAVVARDPRISGQFLSAAVEATLARSGAPDVLVNNAGYGLLGALEEASEDELARVFDVNLFAPLRLVQRMVHEAVGRAGEQRGPLAGDVERHGDGQHRVSLDEGGVLRAPAPALVVATPVAAGETVLRRGTVITAREIGMLAACGLATVEVVRKPKVAVLSTGDELVPLGEALRPAGVYDSNGAIVAAAVTEAGGADDTTGVVVFTARFADRDTEQESVLSELRDCSRSQIQSSAERGGRGEVCGWNRSPGDP